MGGRYAKDDGDDVLPGEYPFGFSPPLPWRFSLSGTHSALGSFRSSGKWQDGPVDTLRFNVGIGSNPTEPVTRVRMFSDSMPGSSVVDMGQNYKNLALLAETLGWPPLNPLYGCGRGQARPPTLNMTTMMIQNVDGVCLDAKERNQNGGVVQMWDCDPTNLNQLWGYDGQSGLIKNIDGLCLAASVGRVLTWACDPTDKNQQWQIDKDIEPRQIRLRHGICLDASERSSNGGKVLMWTCDVNNVNQQWNTRAAS